MSGDNRQQFEQIAVSEIRNVFQDAALLREGVFVLKRWAKIHDIDLWEINGQWQLLFKDGHEVWADSYAELLKMLIGIICPDDIEKMK